MDLKGPDFAPKSKVICLDEKQNHLTAEAVQGASLAFQGVHDVHGGDGLPLGVLGVGDGIADDILEEHLQDTTGLLVDEAGDTLDTTTASQTADGGLGDTLDVITQHLAMPLGASLSESLSSLAASSHLGLSLVTDNQKFFPAGAKLTCADGRLLVSFIVETFNAGPTCISDQFDL